MTNEQPLRFNALTDPWLPLVQADGTTVWASFVEVLTGEKDGRDLDYPRDDFRVFSRLLLSALTQALLPAKTKAELLQRLTTPMQRAEIDRRIATVLQDFDLFGPRPFLQIVAPATIPKKKGAAPFVFPNEDLFTSPSPIEAISLPIALVTLFVEQALAGGGGSGHITGPAGQPGALTLVDTGSVRESAWANTLFTDTVGQKYAKEDVVPWSSQARAITRRDAIGLVTGLFFQPRGIWLIPMGEGVCSFSGRQGPLVRCSPRFDKSGLEKKTSGGEDLWQHPCAALATNSQGIAPVRLSATQPAWTGLAQLLHPISKNKAKKNHPSEGPAPVLQQWKSLGLRDPRFTPHLIVLDFDRDKASVKRRFFESYPLTGFLAGNTEMLELLRALVDDAQMVEGRLNRALISAHDSQRRGGFALHEAEASFWRDSEPSFHRWLAATVVEEKADDAARPTLVQDLSADMMASIRKSALSIFDAHVEVSEFDPAKAARVAKARHTLRSDLYFPASPRVTTAPAKGVQNDHAAK
jgi:CRISPR type I-E-associated protein CasA/Cse1